MESVKSTITSLFVIALVPVAGSWIDEMLAYL